MRLLVSVLLAAAALSAQTVDFYHVTDTHLFEPAGFHPALAESRALLQPSRGRLAAFTREMNPAPQFLLVTGDLVDGYCFDSPAAVPLCNQIELFSSIARQSPARVYPVLGNHDVTIYHPPAQAKGNPVKDMSRAAEARAAWGKALPAFRKSTYYSFPQRAGARRFRFIVLDNGDISDQLFAQKQIDWLRHEVRRRRDETLILALHIPLAKDKFSQAVLEILAGHPAPVLALTGHNHTDALIEIPLNGKTLLQVRTAIFAGPAAPARRITLAPGRIDTYATNRPQETLRTIPLP
jgi:predicted MPP superfamily phosphohydrolase